MKKQPVIAAVWLAAVLASGFAWAQDEPVSVRDAVVAVVNNQAITLQDILDRSGPTLAALDQDTSLSADERQQRKSDCNAVVLRQIIDQKLLIAEGNRLLNVNEDGKKRFDEDVAAYIKQEIRKAGGDATFHEALQKKGLTYKAYAERMRDQMLIEFVKREFVLRDLSVAPREVLEYYRQNLNQFEEPAQVKFRGIFVSTDSKPSREAARKSAEDIMAQLTSAPGAAHDKNPADFARIAKERSSLRAEEGGLWDFTEAGILPKPVDDLLFSLPVGGIGGPVETEMPGPSGTESESGFLIVKVEERKPARTRAFEEVQRSIEDMLLTRMRISRFDALLHRLEVENYVEYIQ